MKKLRSVLMAFLLMAFGYLHAQTFALRIDSSFLTSLPDTLRMNDTLALTITIHNDSAVGFNGFIALASKIDTNAATLDTTIGGGFYYPSFNNIDTIPAGGSITRSLIIYVYHPPFIIGSSGVVIWPVYNSGAGLLSSVDSLRKTVVITGPSGIGEEQDKKLQVYQSANQLIVRENDQYLLKTIKLYNAFGKLVTEQPISLSASIDMKPFASGVYLVEITYADNTRRFMKIMNVR